ncbi:electron transporter RnfD [candidate division KSB1 bacterium]|nr:MAG: electron transporter RnfD [candidate division KSB1 bacterium]
MEAHFYVSSSPHIRDRESIRKIMFSVVVALIPALVGAVYFFGARALWITVVSVLTAIITEGLIQKLRKVPVTISDGSAVVTGILLAYNLPAGCPYWLPVIGSFFAIAIGKQAFGGLGYNPMNPALLGRAFLLASWPVRMTSEWVAPRGGTLSGITTWTGATPLNLLKQARKVIHHKELYTDNKIQESFRILSDISSSYSALFWGKVGGCLGETSVILLLIGALYLLYKRYIGLEIPVTYIGVVALLAWAFNGTKGLFTGDPLFHILSGGLILGAFFMATDMVTTPVTVKGKLIFGAGCGVLTVFIRQFGGYPEGVSYSILLMNLTTPIIDRYVKPKIFGHKKVE